MIKESIKFATKTDEFKRIINFQDFKSTVSKLDYIFYGSIFVAVCLAVQQLFKWYGLYWLLVPACVILTCYIGRFLYLVHNIYENGTEQFESTIRKAHSMDSLSKNENKNKEIKKALQKNKE